MSDAFERRVRAAAIAGWWTALVALAFIVLQWLVYLAVTHAGPQWVLSWLGTKVDWAFVETVWFWAIAVLKFVLWLVVLIALWLSLWARQLRKLSAS